MDASMVSQMKAMEWGANATGPSAPPNESRRLMRMYADLSMQADLLKEEIGKK
jgi:putative transposase